jgi:2-polyprenyl-3-methyl-5-hydroxy-6-metoxy-1,4-benzoquinol methylase
VKNPEHKTYSELVEEELSRPHMASSTGVRDYVFSAGRRGEELAEFLASRIAVEGARVLDAGTGDGGVAVALARRECRVTAFDNTWNNVARARQLARESGVAPLFIVMDAQHFALSRSDFDLVILSDLLEHVGSPDDVVRAVAENIKPGGWCYVSVPNTLSPWNLFRDQHYRLFGVSIMPKRLASLYVTRVRKRSTMYAIESSFTWRSLRRLFARHGITLEVCGEFRSLSRLDDPSLLIDTAQRAVVKAVSILRLKPLMRRLFLSRPYRRFLAPALVCMGRKAQ